MIWETEFKCELLTTNLKIKLIVVDCWPNEESVGEDEEEIIKKEKIKKERKKGRWCEEVQPTLTNEYQVSGLRLEGRRKR